MSNLFKPSWERKYSRDFNSNGGAMLRTDLLELDNLRQQQKTLYDKEYAAYQADNTQYSKAEYKTVYGLRDRDIKQVVTGYTFAPSRELADLQSRVKALEYYDAKMPEAANTRQAQRELEETKARIAKRKADEARRRDELRSLRIGGQDVHTSQQGVLGG